jgi:hypothetical protein
VQSLVSTGHPDVSRLYVGTNGLNAAVERRFNHFKSECAMKSLLIACICIGAIGGAFAASDPDVSHYDGICDASAAIALNRDHFAVADDERNVLMVYRRRQPAPVRQIALNDFLGTKDGKESDIEGSAAIGERVFWIASHGRNSKGKVREERYRFFATDIVAESTPPSLKPAGSPYLHLLDDLLAADNLKSLGLDAASRRAPEADGGLNIEGLAAMPTGGLLIGFRNPIVDTKALLVPLENPQEVINGHRAKLGPPVLLDLGNRGIRSIERVGDSYLVVAGPAADEGSFALYKWSGKSNDAPKRIEQVKFDGLSPEALFAIPDSDRVQILSDDGGLDVGGTACKTSNEAVKSFRSLVVQKP